MECLFAPELTKTSHEITLVGDEFTHARALRLREGERVMLSNGAGLCAEVRVQTMMPKQGVFAVVRLLSEHHELQTSIHLALGILDNRERMEWAIEKCTELGVQAFTPLITRHSQRNRINVERLEAKALAAMKQCQRARLPVLHPATSLETLLSHHLPETTLLLADAEGSRPHPLPSRDEMTKVLILVGPEGGFSQQELVLIASHSPFRWNLASSRLRAETAAIAAVSAVVLQSSNGS